MNRVIKGMRYETPLEILDTGQTHGSFNTEQFNIRVNLVDVRMLNNPRNFSIIKYSVKDVFEALLLVENDSNENHLDIVCRTSLGAKRC